MVNRFLKQCSMEFRLFLYATAFIIGLHAVLPTDVFDALAILWSVLTIPVAVIGTWRHSFWKGQLASGLPLIIMGLLDLTSLSTFVGIYVIGAVLSLGALIVSLAFGQGQRVKTTAKPIDDAVVSVVAKVDNSNTTAAEVLSRFGLDQRSAP